MEPQAGDRERTQDKRDNALVAVLCYVPMLFFLPVVAAPEDDTARFHGRQSLLLFAALVAVWVVIWVIDLLFGRAMGSVIVIGFLFRALSWVVHNIVGTVVSLAYLGLMIAGMVHAAGGERWRMPFLGAYADKLSVL